MNFDIDTIKRKLLIKLPFFGAIIANVNYKENNKIKTVKTDGKTIYYNKNFIEKRTKSDQLFIFAHEICHIAFNHIQRIKGKDPKTWNQAADAVTNAMLWKDGFPLPEDAIDLKWAANYTTEEVYEILLKENQNKSNLGKKQDGSNPEESENKNPENEDKSSDSHSMWDEAQNQEEIQNEDQSNQQNLEEATEKISELGEKEAFEKNKKERIKQLEELSQELSQIESQIGTETNSETFKVEQIGKPTALIDWRHILKNVTYSDVDWTYENADIEYGVICARLEEQPQPETEILLDTSGSVSKELLKNFLKECINILHYSKIKVGCFDTEFYGFKEIRTLKDIENIEFQGKGGTDFNVAVQSFSKRAENKIIFTDGCATPPQLESNIIWLVYGHSNVKIPGGKVIYIDEKQLNTLNNSNLQAYTKIKKR